jgi:hypothetical protein
MGNNRLRVIYSCNGIDTKSICRAQVLIKENNFSLMRVEILAILYGHAATNFYLFFFLSIK